MENSKAIVDTMKKVHLRIQAASDREMVNLVGEPVELDFVFGVGSSGITPFEYDLSGLGHGESIVVPVQRRQVSEYFEHFACAVLQSVPGTEDVYLQATITGIRQAENREIVSAMARSTSCGGGCDCGCGQH